MKLLVNQERRARFLCRFCLITGGCRGRELEERSWRSGNRLYWLFSFTLIRLWVRVISTEISQTPTFSHHSQETSTSPPGGANLQCGHPHLLRFNVTLLFIYRCFFFLLLFCTIVKHSCSPLYHHSTLASLQFIFIFECFWTVGPCFGYF